MDESAELDRLAIVIPSKNGEHLTTAIQSARSNKSWVIVVLNGSDLETVQAVREVADHVVSLEEANLGAARQTGLDAARGHAALFLDDDCVLRTGAVGGILDELASHDVVRVGLDYVATSWRGRLVRSVRRLTTTDVPTLFLPLAFSASFLASKDYQLFDTRLEWGEDWVLAQVLGASKIRVGSLAEAAVFHSELGVCGDLASAWRLGKARFLRVKLGIEMPRKFLEDLAFRREGRRFSKTVRAIGLTAAAYHVLGWRLSYKTGYYAALVGDVLRRQPRQAKDS